jgi:hypothetical protein
MGASDSKLLMKNNQVKFVGDKEALSLFESKFHKASNENDTGNASIPIRTGRITPPDSIQPLKSGWLLKKRDIMTGIK